MTNQKRLNNNDPTSQTYVADNATAEEEFVWLFLEEFNSPIKDMTSSEIVKKARRLVRTAEQWS